MHVSAGGGYSAPMGTRLLIAAVGVLGLCGTAFSSVASTPLTKERLIAWLDAEAAAAQDPEFLRGKVISYRLHYGFVPTAAEVEQIRRQVEGKPDHPLRHELERMERRLRDGQDRKVVRCVRFDATRWRIATEELSLGQTIDDAADGNLNWALSSVPGQLLIADKDSPEGFSSRFMLFDVGPGVRLSTLIFSGAHCWGAWSRRHVSQTIEGDRWTAAIATFSPEGERSSEYVFEGRYDEGKGVPIVIKRRPSDAFAPGDDFKDVIEFSGHQWNEPLRRFVPSTVVIHNDPTEGGLRIEFLGATEISEREFSELTKPPVPGREDPWRQGVVIKTVLDTRPSVGRYEAVDAGGGRSLISRLSAPPEEDQTSWRWAGWAALSAVFTVFVVLVWRRRSQASP